MSKEDKEFIIDECKSFLNSVRKLFSYKYSDRQPDKKILAGGGYGYGNTGDEAQCNETLKLLTERYPDYEVINLTPNPEYSRKEHPGFRHEAASRVLIFNQWRNCNCFDFNNSILRKIVFLLKCILIYINAVFVRAGFPTVGINADVSKFLYELKTSALFYFCGGGYLTGQTLSRLWDGILICRLAWIFKTPVVMSGQTIGIWGNRFNEKFAKWGFKHVKVITVRDEDFSLNDLKKIGLSGENYFATHDDALFCTKSEQKQINIDNYLTINFHYWGMDVEEKNIYIKKINKIIKYILENTNYNIAFIPMHNTDKWSFDDYIKLYPDSRILSFEYDYDFRKVRKVIADSQMCITMKHHPIIFAVGENVPVISLAFSKYYVHKNFGALTQYGLQDYSINFEDEDYFEQFVRNFNLIKNNCENIITVIKEHKNILAARKEKFLKMVDEYLS